MAKHGANVIAIDAAELRAAYIEMRELSEGRGAHQAAASHGIDFLFQALGEPGAGDE